jgi:phosphoenolpyruvate---glycerone phosphotransferase subunit DhaL
METQITFDKIKEAIIAIAGELNKNRQYYNDLDSPLGDSDHGDSVCSAFKTVKETLNNLNNEDKDIGFLLKTVGKAIIFSGGGAMGPLYGSAFMEAGKAVSSKSSLSYADLVEMWNAFLSAMGKRNEKVGEKTMYDTISPAFEALKSAYSSGVPLKEAVGLVNDAAKCGMESTRNMIALRGRSSRLGERALGHIDPGAASMYAVISTFFCTIENS